MTNKFAIFASGNGSNAEVLAKHALKHHYPLNLVFSDKDDANVHNRMKGMGIESMSIEKENDSKSAYEDKILKVLKEREIKWIFLAGYMKILSSSFIQQFYDKNAGINRIINIHPSLLPSFPGRDGYGDAFRYGVAVSGVTIHCVDDGVDTGPIIVQKSFVRSKEDNLESFKQKGMAIEHELYPIVLDMVMKNELIVYKRQ